MLVDQPQVLGERLPAAFLVERSQIGFVVVQLVVLERIESQNMLLPDDGPTRPQAPEGHNQQPEKTITPERARHHFGCVLLPRRSKRYDGLFRDPVFVSLHIVHSTTRDIFRASISDFCLRQVDRRGSNNADPVPKSNSKCNSTPTHGDTHTCGAHNSPTGLYRLQYVK